MVRSRHLQRLQVMDKLDHQDQESGDESQVQDFMNNQVPDGLERVCVPPVIVRSAPRGKPPLEEVVALVLPVRTEHERG